MLEKTIKYIFIYISLLICVGCENSLVGVDETCSNCVLELDIPELTKDDNGYHHLNYNYDYIQTFAKIEAYVGVGYVHLSWVSDAEHCVQMWNYTDCNDVVNPASYSGNDGFAHQMMGVHQEHIGDTITVYCGYYDEYNNEYLNQLRVIVDE